MIEIKEGLRAIFWDFDGVLMDSNAVRNNGFAVVLSEFPEEQVERLLAFHRANGGLSRYVKFRYFFEHIRKETISDEEITAWAAKFSFIVKQQLLDNSLLIEETVNWVKKNYNNVAMHIVSGSDQTELRFICNHHEIGQYFQDIMGSPTPKKELVSELLKRYKYEVDCCVLIGDSVNDFEAAETNNIKFLAYNNPSLSDFNTY